MRIYVFGNEATAEAFKMTAYHFYGDELEVRRVGTALVMSEEVYRCVIDNTYAPHASIVAEEVT